MFKRILAYWMVAFVFAALIWGFFYSGANGDIVEFFLSPYFQKAYGVQVQLKNYEGGILKGIELEQVHLNWPKRSILGSIYAEKVYTGFKISDFFGTHTADQFVFFDSIQVGLQRLIPVKLPRPFQFLDQSSPSNGSALRQGNEVFKINRGRILIDNLRETFLRFNQVLLRYSIDKKIVKELQILASSSVSGHQNLFAFYLQDQRTKIVVSDYSVTILKDLTPYFQVLDGVLDAEIIIEGDQLKKVSLHLKDLKIRLLSGEEDTLQLDLIYENDNLEIKTLKVERPGIDFELSGIAYHLLNNPVVDFKSILKEEDRVFKNELRGSLERPEMRGEFQESSSESSVKSLSWRFQTGGLTLVQRGLLIHGIDGSIELEKLSPLRIKGDLILSGNSVVFRKVVFEHVARMDGMLTFFPELFVDAQIKLERDAFKKRSFLNQKTFQIARLDGHFFGNIKQWIFVSKGLLKTDQGKSDFEIRLKKDLWSLKIKRKSVDLKEIHVPGVELTAEWDYQKLIVSLLMPESGNRVSMAMDLSMNHVQDVLRWLHHAKDCTREGDWNFRISLPDWKMGSFGLAGDLDFTGTYRVSAEQMTVDGALEVKNFKVNNTSFGEGKGSVHFDAQGGVLKLEDLKIGDGYLLKGNYDFLKNQLIFIFDLTDVSISDLKVFSPNRRAPFLDGKMKGQIRLEGRPDYPSWHGRLEMNSGQFLELKFEEAFFNLSGYGTIVDLRESKIIAKNGQWKIIGNIDLGSRRPFRNVRFAMDPQNMNLKGIAIRNDEEMKETTFEKQIGKGLALSLKARQASEEADRSNQDEGAEVQLQYEYYPSQDVLFRMDENEQMFGVRKKVEF